LGLLSIFNFSYDHSFVHNYEFHVVFVIYIEKYKGELSGLRLSVNVKTTPTLIQLIFPHDNRGSRLLRLSHDFFKCFFPAPGIGYVNPEDTLFGILYPDLVNIGSVYLVEPRGLRLFVFNGFGFVKGVSPTIQMVHFVVIDEESEGGV